MNGNGIFNPNNSEMRSIHEVYSIHLNFSMHERNNEED